MKLEDPARASIKSKVQGKNDEGTKVGKTSNEILLLLTPGSSDPTFLTVKFRASIRGVVPVVQAILISCCSCL